MSLKIHVLNHDDPPNQGDVTILHGVGMAA